VSGDINDNVVDSGVVSHVVVLCLRIIVSVVFVDYSLNMTELFAYCSGWRVMVEQKLCVTLITGRTIDQGVAKELGKGSQEYFDHVAICFLDSSDIKKLDGVNVQVTSPYGSVVVKAKTYPYGSIPGMIFMPCGLWANAICSDETDSIGMPTFRGFTVEVEPAPDKSILTLDELLKQQFGK
jgi:formylmethanofuran dehydrogenase subunit D